MIYNGGNRFNTSVTGSNSWIRMGPKWRMLKWCQMQVWNNNMYTAWEWGWQNQMNYFSSQHQEIKMVSRHRQSGFCNVFVGCWAFKWSPIKPLATYSLTLQNSLYPTHPPSHTFKWAPSICLTSGTWKGLTAYIAHAGSSVPHCTANSQVCISNINLWMALNSLILFVCHTLVFSGPSKLKSAVI